MASPFTRLRPLALAACLTIAAMAAVSPTPARAVVCASSVALPTSGGLGDYRLRDHFESGGFGKWTGRTAEGDAKAYVGTARKVSGWCAGRLVVTSAWNSKANVWRQLPSGTRDVWVTGWFRVDREGLWGSNVPTWRLFAGSQRIADVHRQNGTGDLWLRTANGSGGWRYTKLNRRIALGTWHRIQLHVYANWSGSDIEVRVDGDLAYRNLSHWLPVGRLDRAMIGAEHRRQVMDLWFDDAVIRSS